MDNSRLYSIEEAGAKVYFFGECVWATILKVPISHYKLAVVGGDKSQILGMLENYEVQSNKQTALIREDGNTYEFYFLIDFESIPLDPIPINNAILSLDGKVYRADDLHQRTLQITNTVLLDYPEEMLRLCRIASQTEFKISVTTWVAIHNNARLIKPVVKRNPAFIGQQLNAILVSKTPSIGLTYLWETGLLQYILPELARCHEISQTRRGAQSNVWSHTLLAIDASENSPLIRWTMLFHDMAKPLTLEVSEDGKVHFFKHEMVGAQLAEEYMTRYKLSVNLISTVRKLIEHHMFDADPKLTTKGVRRLIRRVGKELIFELLKVRIADRLGSVDPPSMDKITLLKQKIEKELANV
jgi:putative nucleotidyltransferase with HDIG domain